MTAPQLRVVVWPVMRRDASCCAEPLLAGARLSSDVRTRGRIPDERVTTIVVEDAARKS